MAANAPFSVGRVLGRTFQMWAKNIVTFTILGLIIYSPALLHAALAFPGEGEDPRTFVGVQNILQGLLSFMATAAVIHGVFQQLRGQPVGIGACLRVCLRRFFPVLGVSLLTGLVIFVCVLPVAFVAAAASLGPLAMLLSLIVAILLFCMFWVAVPVAVVEKPGVGASLTRSQALTKGHRSAIFLVMLVIGVILVAVTMIVQLAITNANVVLWTELLISVVLGSIFAIANAVGYHDLRVAKEGVGIEDLVAVFA
ncbi:MAG TPA: hypothetical protein VFY93_09485 [Planctomycetota bacterium]|nr:hypothetical protein [Planctomycetota bacterium]